ncbi:hypothetical protein D046_9264, partial [Vibrio parahaemolyticus V-223/04]
MRAQRRIFASTNTLKSGSKPKQQRAQTDSSLTMLRTAIK